MRDVFPQTDEQLCWNHKMLNVLDALPKHMQAKAKPHLTAMMYAETREQAWRERKRFERTLRSYPKAPDAVLSLSPRALEAFADFEYCGVAVLASETPDRSLASV